MLPDDVPPAWLQGKALLIFDFDGTVADTSPLHAAAFLEVLAPLGVPVEYESIAGLKTSDALLFCARSVGLVLSVPQLNALVAAKQALVREMISRDLKPLPGVDNFLRWARTRFKLSMATSGSRGTVELALKKLGYEEWFDPLVCAEDVQRAKPNPDVFLRVLELTGYSEHQALVFEDSEAGIESARMASIPHIDVRGFDWSVLGTSKL